MLHPLAVCLLNKQTETEPFVQERAQLSDPGGQTPDPLSAPARPWEASHPILKVNNRMIRTFHALRIKHVLAQFVIKTKETNILQIGAPLLRPWWAGHCDGGAGLQQDDALAGFVIFF